MSITVFFSYSHRDEELRDKLANHLSILKRQGTIEEWHDRKIPPGDEWDQRIKAELEAADIILLLISADFLASDYCWDIEVARAMALHEAGTACVIPIILRPVDWSGALFGKLAGLPTDRVPVTEWNNLDSAFTDVAKAIRLRAEALAQKKTPRDEKRNKRLVGSEVLREIPVWVGRDQLLARLSQEFLDAETAGARPKMLVLVGQGGMGKTSLAVKLLEAAGVSVQSSALLPSCGYEQVICFKAQEGTSFDEVTSVLLGALSVQAGEGLPPQERIQKVIEGLQHRRCLVLIDNLEVVLHPASGENAGFAMVPEWGLLLNALANLPHQSQVILTSREQPQELGDLRFPGMEPDGALVQVEYIGGVSEEAGVELLKKRGLRDSEADLRWVAGRVQGNAFMLTLLANLAKGKPGYLRKHPQLVTQRAEPILRTQLERQGEAGRELLKRMCVLRVPIDLQGLTFLRLYQADESEFGRFWMAVEFEEPAELSPEEVWATQDLVKQLVDCSLVQCQYDEQRQEELYDLHRLSAEFLQAEYKAELPDLLKRVYSFYRTGKALEHPKTLEDLRLALEAQHFAFQVGNYDEALSLLYSFEQYLEWWGHWSLLKDLCEQLLPKVALESRPYLLQRIGLRYRDWGNWDAAERFYQEALELATEQDNRSLIAGLKVNLGSIEQNRGHWDAAERLFKQSLEIETELGDRSGMAATWGSLGDIERNRGHWDEAERLYKQSLELHTELGDRSGMATSWGQLGYIESCRGNWDEAERLYKQSLELQTELGDRSGMATYWGLLGYIESCRGNWDEAERLYKQSLEIEIELGDRSGMASSWGVLGDIERKRGHWDEAERLYKQSLELRTELGDRSGMATSIGSLGETELGRGNLDVAEALLKQALAQMQAMGMAWHIAEVNYNLMILEYKRGNRDRAESHYAIAYQQFTQLGAMKDLERIAQE